MKAKALDASAVAAARRVLDGAGVRHARDIHVEAIAAKHGAWVVYGPMATARASIVRTLDRALIWVDDRTRGEPWARFTVAHELGHHLLHPVEDHFEQCNGEEKSGSSFHIEREANHFSTELLMPETLARPVANRTPTPTLDDAYAFSCAFRTSLIASVLRFVQLSEAPCAVALSEEGRVKWASESSSFGGKIVRRRPLSPDSFAGRIAVRPSMLLEAEKGGAVDGAAWGGDGAFFEQSVLLSALPGARAASAVGGAGASSVLSWVVGAGGA